MFFVKIPGTKAGIPAIEEATCSGVPINVTLLFSREQYLAAAEAYIRGIERRVAAGLNADVPIFRMHKGAAATVHVEGSENKSIFEPKGYSEGIREGIE